MKIIYEYDSSNGEVVAFREVDDEKKFNFLMYYVEFKSSRR